MFQYATSRKFFQAACEQIAFPAFDKAGNADGSPVDTFRKNPVHEAVALMTVPDK